MSEETKGSKVIRAGIGYTVGNYLLKGLTFLTVPLFSRLLSTAEYGVFNAYLAYQTILYLLVGLALHTSLKNAKYRYKEEFDRYNSGCILLVIVHLLLWLLVCNLLYPLYGGAAGFSRVVVNVLLLDSFGTALIQFFNVYVGIYYRYISFLKLSVFHAVANLALSVLLIAAAIIVACVVFFRVNAIQVEGNVRYTPEEIIDASGIRIGDNLIALSRSRISTGIRAQLPYVEGVAIHRSYPDKLVIRVTERVASASVDSAEGRWLISSQGKLLEKDNGSVGTVQVAGLTAVGPYAGGMLQVAEEEQATLGYVKELLAAVETHGILGQCSRLECSSATSITLYYGIYRIKLPRGGDYDYYVRLALKALEMGLSSGKMQEGQSGLLDLTVTENRARFIPDH